MVYTVKSKEFLPCPFCGGVAELRVNLPVYGMTGAWVECRECGARGTRGTITEVIWEDNGALYTPATPAAIRRGKAAAVRGWNARRATE